MRTFERTLRALVQRCKDFENYSESQYMADVRIALIAADVLGNVTLETKYHKLGRGIAWTEVLRGMGKELRRQEAIAS